MFPRLERDRTRPRLALARDPPLSSVVDSSNRGQIDSTRNIIIDIVIRGPFVIYTRLIGDLIAAAGGRPTRFLRD